MMVLGVDPGKYGACVLIERTTGGALTIPRSFVMPLMDEPRAGKIFKIVDIPTLGQIMAEVAGTYEIDRAYVERVGARPGQGIASMFVFGVNYGSVRGALAACDIPTELIAPKVWQKYHGLNERMSYERRKRESRLLATELLPHYGSLFHRAKDDGPAEAALLALYGIHEMTKEDLRRPPTIRKAA